MSCSVYDNMRDMHKAGEVKIFILTILLTLPIWCIDYNIISDYDFTNWQMKSSNFYHDKFDKYINDWKVQFIYDTAKRGGINPMVIFVQAQKESSQFGSVTRSIDNYFLGCSIHIDRYRGNSNNQSFVSQVRYSVSSMRKHFDISRSRSNTCYIWDNGKKEVVSNAATYSLYRYTPLYKVTMADGAHGNYLFKSIWNRFTK